MKVLGNTPGSYHKPNYLQRPADLGVLGMSLTTSRRNWSTGKNRTLWEIMHAAGLPRRVRVAKMDYVEAWFRQET
jgi:hypothetical protein